MRGKFARAYDPEKSRSYKAYAHDYMRAACAEPFARAVPLLVEIEAVRACPKSQYRKRVPHGRRWSTSKPDIDNLAKIVLDAGNGVLWFDDAQVVDVRVRKLIGKQEELPYVRLVVSIAAAVPAR